MGDVGDAGMEAWGGPAAPGVPNGAPGAQIPDPQPPQQPAPPADTTPVDPMRYLLESVIHIGNAAGNAHQEQVLSRQALEALVQKIERLSASTGTPVSSGNGSTRGNVRVRDPRVFSGKATEVDAFLEEVDAAILLQPALRDADETVKCHYFASWLGDGAPRSWLKAMKTRDELFLDDYVGLVYEFRKRFEDSDIENKMIHKIESLKQESSAAVYANQFEEYLRYIDWTENYAIKRFDRGLKSELRMQLLGKPQPATLSEWIPSVIELDNELHNLRIETRQQGVKVTTSNSGASRYTQPQRASNVVQPVPASRPAAVPAPAAPGSSDVVPMEVDAIRHSKLTPQERQRRFDNNLCLYCGEGSHRLAQCPLCLASTLR